MWIWDNTLNELPKEIDEYCTGETLPLLNKSSLGEEWSQVYILDQWVLDSYKSCKLHTMKIRRGKKKKTKEQTNNFDE